MLKSGSDNTVLHSKNLENGNYYTERFIFLLEKHCGYQSRVLLNSTKQSYLYPISL